MIKRLLQAFHTIKPNWWAYIFTFLFIALNSVFLYFEYYYFMLLPFGVLIAYMALTSVDKLVFITIFLIPLSIPLQEFYSGFSFDMSLPAEPLVFGILLVFLFKLLKESRFDKKILTHPISLAILFNLFWMGVTSVTSEMPVVSFKFLLVRVWFLVAFYFLTIQIFKRYKNIKLTLWLYIIPLMIVMVYTISRQASLGIFDKQVAHWVMSPFYNDHTAYAAIMAMYFPFLVGSCFKSNSSSNMKFIIGAVTVFFAVAIVLSYTRASWVSLAGALGVFFVIKLKINKHIIIWGALIVASLLLIYRTEIFIHLEQNRQDSSADLSEHVKSISNIATDASNLERINRWKSALRMFEDKAFLGHGPGTYQFLYAPYQFSYERTIISTNAGDGGTAHSEYLGPLCESGVFGLLSFALIIATTIVVALRLYFKLHQREVKMIVLSSFLGLVTYYLHGFLNNFLDTDKASAPFWGFTAIIVAIDIYHQRQDSSIQAKSLKE